LISVFLARIGYRSRTFVGPQHIDLFKSNGQDTFREMRNYCNFCNIHHPVGVI